LITTDPAPDPGSPFLHMTDRRLTALKLRYCDLVAAADVVVTKLGYGIVSECIANQTAILHVARDRFREYPVLAEAVKRSVPSAQIQLDESWHDDWKETVLELKNASFPPPPDCDGAQVIAEQILQK
jgi:L-arabinokinase